MAFDTPAAFIASLHSLSDDPKRRAMQIALAAVDMVLTSDSIVSDDECAALSAAYEELQRALEPN